MSREGKGNKVPYFLAVDVKDCSVNFNENLCQYYDRKICWSYFDEPSGPESLFSRKMKILTKKFGSRSFFPEPVGSLPKKKIKLTHLTLAGKCRRGSLWCQRSLRKLIRLNFILLQIFVFCFTASNLHHCPKRRPIFRDDLDFYELTLVFE